MKVDSVSPYNQTEVAQAQAGAEGVQKWFGQTLPDLQAKATSEEAANRQNYTGSQADDTSKRPPEGRLSESRSPVGGDQANDTPNHFPDARKLVLDSTFEDELHVALNSDYISSRTDTLRAAILAAHRRDIVRELEELRPFLTTFHHGVIDKRIAALKSEPPKGEPK